MRLRKLLLLVFVLGLVMAACGDDEEGNAGAECAAEPAVATSEPGILKVGSDIPYPPFEDFDASGEAIGFDIDLMNEIACRLGLEVTWVDTDFDTIFTQLAQGNFDVVASATTITALSPSTTREAPPALTGRLYPARCLPGLGRLPGGLPRDPR